jgi:multiple sugar transport system ATP-binding protein
VGGLALKGVSKHFGATLVLDDVSLEIGAQEFLVVLGPSGCGKSTLLRAIAGLESIDAGQIEISGRRVDELPPGQRGVALVFQGYALYPHMTVRGNIEFGLRNARLPREQIARRLAEVARTLELQSLLERLPAELSGGQRQRVAIGRALVKEPQLFMFDEPLSNLDAALRTRMRQEIANLHRRIKTTMLFVTHDQTEAMTLADRIVIMKEQRIEQVGTPLEIYNHPATEFVASFIGTPAMNLLNVTARGGGAVALSDGAILDLPAAPPLESGAPLRLGIRPEALTLCEASGASLRATVDFIEYLGDRSHVFATLSGGERVVALDTGSCRCQVGEAVGLRVKVESAHLFQGGRNCRMRP